MVFLLLSFPLQLPQLLNEVTDYESFAKFVKNEKKTDRHLAEMLKFVPELKWSVDESQTTIGYVYHQVSEVHVLYSYANSEFLFIDYFLLNTNTSFYPINISSETAL